MTTMAALLGGLPLALGTGTGSELRRPLGIAIVGGLIFSQMLTLYTTPVVYLYLDRFRLRWARMRAGACAAASRRPPAGGHDGSDSGSRGARRTGGRRPGSGSATACTVGPDYERPPAPVPPAFKETAPGRRRRQPATGSRREPRDDAVRAASGGRSSATRSSNALEEQVAVSNQTIAQAEAQYRGARAVVRGARADFFPTLSVAPSVSRSQGRGVQLRRPPRSRRRSTTYSARGRRLLGGRRVGPHPAQRRGRRSARRQASAADLETIRLSMHAELATRLLRAARGRRAERSCSTRTSQAYEKALQLTTRPARPGRRVRRRRRAGGDHPRSRRAPTDRARA